MYRTTAHATTNTPPCELLMSYHLRTRLDLLRPGKYLQSNLSKSNDMMNVVETSNLTKVMLSRHSNTNKWEPGIVVERVGPVLFNVQLQNGQTCKRHLDHFILHYRLDSPNYLLQNQIVVTVHAVYTQSELPRRNPPRNRRPPNRFQS